MKRSDLDKLQTRLISLTADYKALKEICEEKVMQWVWFKGEYSYPPEPFFFERSGQKQGKRLTEEPSKEDKLNCDCYQYGFDQQNRVIVERSDYNAYDQPYKERFFVHKDNSIEVIYYDSDMISREHQALTLSIYHFQGDKLIRSEFVGFSAANTEIYKCQQEILTEVEHYGWKQTLCSDRVLYFQEYSFQEKYSYNEIGQLSCIKRLRPEEPVEVVYQRLKKGESIKKLLSIAEYKLFDTTLQLIRNSNITERVYCLALVYGSDMVLPPVIALGLASERSLWIEEADRTKSNYSIEDIWNPADFFYYNQESLQINDEELIELCTLINQQLRIKGKMNLAKNLLNRVAAKLMEVDWYTLLNITSDFIVYATDFEQAEFHKNIKVSVPESRRSVLRQNGFLL